LFNYWPGAWGWPSVPLHYRRPPQASDPSFDCSKADHDAEELICRDNELAALDNQLAVVYHAALKNFLADERKNLKAMQRGWIKGRNDCWKADELRSCVKFAYESRITELQIQGSLITVPEPTKYQCDDGEHDYLTAIFYQETAMPAVVLTRVNDRDSSLVIAWPTPSGSGAKYQGRNVNFWNKGNEAMVEWNNDKLKCRAMSTKR
jgi:uncharacterized protein